MSKMFMGFEGMEERMCLSFYYLTINFNFILINLKRPNIFRLAPARIDQLFRHKYLMIDSVMNIIRLEELKKCIHFALN